MNLFVADFSSLGANQRNRLLGYKAALRSYFCLLPSEPLLHEGKLILLRDAVRINPDPFQWLRPLKPIISRGDCPNIRV